MDFVKIEAWPRQEAGKGPSTRLRREGKIPAIAYGAGTTARSLSLIPKDLITALQGPYGRNVVLEVAVGTDAPFTALVREYTFHPINRTLEHVDLLHIDLNKPVEVSIPLICTGKAAGTVTGGVLRQVYRTLPISCLPSAIPASVSYDVSAMDQGDVAKTVDLKLPEGVTVRLPAEQTIIAIVAPEVEKAEAGAAAEGDAAAAPAAGAAAAPAKPGAAAPAKAPAAAAPAKKEEKKK